nr:chemotaxis regulator [uncultured bacterium]
MPLVLVIDDSKTVLVFVEQILLDASLDVITATDGRKGLQRLRDQPVDLILTDMYMPELDGLDVVRLARRIQPSVPIIVMSSKEGRLNLFDIARALGAVSTLPKPFTREQLLAEVSAVLEAAERNSRQPANGMERNGAHVHN